MLLRLGRVGGLSHESESKSCPKHLAHCEVLKPHEALSIAFAHPRRHRKIYTKKRDLASPTLER